MLKKTEAFQMRMSLETRAKLNQIAAAYNLSASAVLDMLIAKEWLRVEMAQKRDNSL